MVAHDLLSAVLGSAVFLAAAVRSDYVSWAERARVPRPRISDACGPFAVPSSGRSASKPSPRPLDSGATRCTPMHLRHMPPATRVCVLRKLRRTGREDGLGQRFGVEIAERTSCGRRFGAFRFKTPYSPICSDTSPTHAAIAAWPWGPLGLRARRCRKPTECWPIHACSSFAWPPFAYRLPRGAAATRWWPASARPVNPVSSQSDYWMRTRIRQR